MRRGDVYWVRFPAPVGTRPAVLVSREEAYSIKSRITVVPLTRTVRGIPTEVRLGPSDGVPKVGVANADEVVTIPAAALQERIATLTKPKLQELDEALLFALGIRRT